jgi:hypothetical protein
VGGVTTLDWLIGLSVHNMEEEDYINAKWVQEDVDTLYNLLNK